ncbi:hypothetical protein WA556_004893 [Blastocystis sp. ATCC 50177/Nand II]
MVLEATERECVVAEEWLRLADEQETDYRRVGRGRARSNSIDICEFVEKKESSECTMTPEKALYERTKDILNHIQKFPSSKQPNSAHSRANQLKKSSELEFLSSKEYHEFCSERRPTFRVVFFSEPDIDLKELLNGLATQSLLDSSLESSALNYYLLVANDKSLSFNLILSSLQDSCCEAVRKVIVETAKLVVLVVNLQNASCPSQLEVMATHYSQKALCVIGVTSEGHKKVSEAALRSRVNGMVAFTYFEVNLKNKKKLKRVANSLSQLVIQSQFNTEDISVANCAIFVWALLLSHP